MKGCFPPDQLRCPVVELQRETAMKKVEKVTHVGLDCRKNFSTLSGRDATGALVLRERFEHARTVRSCVGVWTDTTG
jgi:hypothetical protein